MSETGVTFNRDDALRDVPDVVKDAPVGPMVGIAAIALSMAMKYADINTIQEGALYQQYKLEGKNIQGLHLEWVLEIATQIEAHLVRANSRVSKMIVACALADGIDGEATTADTEQSEPSTPSIAP